MKMIKKILSGIMIAITAITLGGNAYAASSNMPDIGDYGVWATDNNREMFVEDLSKDVSQFGGINNNKNMLDFVPIEAKIGLAFMDGFSYIAHILESSLVRFTIIFIVLMYMLWMMLEAHNIMIGKAKTKDTVNSILKKGLIVAAWVGVLSIGPAKTFMMIMSPILSIASAICDAILNSVAHVVGAQLPDTCTAIHKYAATHISADNLLNAEAAANIMCLPTRLSGFCYTAISTGWHWLFLGIGRSAFSILCGTAVIIGFIYLAWKFAFMAFGVIADLFLGIMMLPFTAISETVGKTSFKGIQGDIFNGFIKLFSAETLQSQVMRFINAALHFVVLAVVIAVCIGLLSDIIIFNGNSGLPDFNNSNVWVSVFVMALSWYLASHASQIANNIGGTIDDSMGQKLKGDVSNLWSGAKKTTKSVISIIKEAKNKK